LNRDAHTGRAPERRSAADQYVGLPNALHADLMTPADRLDEVARLLALGFLRLRARRRAEKPMILSS
jgi:hypothetical protein